MAFENKHQASQEHLNASNMESGTPNAGRAQMPMIGSPKTMHNNVLCLIGEFVGTFMFLFFSFAGAQVANTPVPADGSNPNTSNLLYSSLCFGFSLTVNGWAFFRVTGGLFNPVVTLALCLTGGMPVLRGLMVFPAQLIAGIAAAGMVSVLFPGPPNYTSRLGGGASIVQGLFIEMFLTAQLVIVIIMLAVVKHKSTYLAPVGIGLAFFLCELVVRLNMFLLGNYYTGGSLNPARSLGPDVINRSFPGYHWIYWVGPLLGSLLACGFYHALRMVRWEKINPGQDYNEWEAREDSFASNDTDPSYHCSQYQNRNRVKSQKNGTLYQRDNQYTTEFPTQYQTPTQPQDFHFPAQTHIAA
ncbi:Major intrinsic protein [Penicillium taxi]|uniref:Major intrinsic protein n=1 Tax=Penicillium taxi TaxID=168475 RepID=UPI002544DC88|nr:Major intrinsic protein [Penicillium taxi]KAJ5899206.1 Major intrinsic protein [Penicillium taxi]